MHIRNIRFIFVNPILLYILVFFLAEYILIGFVAPSTWATVFRITRTVGDVWEWPDEPIKIELQNIEENKQKGVGEGDYVADLCIHHRGGLIYGGDKTTNISTNCYRLPVTSYFPQEPYSIYFFSHSFSSSSFAFVEFFSAHVEHINPNNKTITLSASYVQSYHPNKIVE